MTSKNIKMRCPEFPYCDKNDCAYIHPYKPCSKFPNCTIADACTFLHPICKFGNKCTKMFEGCQFDHDRPFNQYSLQFYKKKCKYWPMCNLGINCKFFHPTRACHNFQDCNKEECKFIHLEDTYVMTNDQIFEYGLSNDDSNKNQRSRSTPTNTMHVPYNRQNRGWQNNDEDSSDESTLHDTDRTNTPSPGNVIMISINLPQPVTEQETPIYSEPPPAYTPNHVHINHRLPSINRESNYAGRSFQLQEKSQNLISNTKLAIGSRLNRQQTSEVDKKSDNLVTDNQCCCSAIDMKVYEIFKKLKCTN